MTIIMKIVCGLLVAASLGLPLAVTAQDLPKRVLLTNVHVFDGVNEDRIESASVLVEGNLIRAVSTEAIEAPPNSAALTTISPCSPLPASDPPP